MAEGAMAPTNGADAMPFPDFLSNSSPRQIDGGAD